MRDKVQVFDLLLVALCDVKYQNEKRSSRQSYGDDAIGYVQLKRDHTLCTVKCRMCPEHKVRQTSYSVSMVIDEKEGVVNLTIPSGESTLTGVNNGITSLGRFTSSTQVWSLIMRSHLETGDATCAGRRVWVDIKEILVKRDRNKSIAMLGHFKSCAGVQKDGYEKVLSKFGDERVDENGKPRETQLRTAYGSRALTASTHKPVSRKLCGLPHDHSTAPVGPVVSISETNFVMVAPWSLVMVHHYEQQNIAAVHRMIETDRHVTTMRFRHL
ncbi:hypothetical protein EVAR_36962_1 [Eumeta japonica]|uniref:Uncharacterized protein n=1 Tax=Eumeta variegata TaxID=151549 RepID=A0A4C1WAG3_EUMVA|nr:hypothetical protein EVAR_36962_1 [Eumeta japonica]